MLALVLAVTGPHAFISTGRAQQTHLTSASAGDAMGQLHPSAKAAAENSSFAAPSPSSRASLACSAALLIAGLGLARRQGSLEAEVAPKTLMRERLSKVDSLESSTATQTLTKPAPEPKEELEAVNLPLLIVALFCATVLGELDKVNISIAVLPIANELKLSEGDMGIASSAFFWGYMLTQLPGAWLQERVPGGAASILALGVFVTSVGTLMTLGLTVLPDDLRWAALPLLCLSRCIVGLGEGVGLPPIATLLAKIPVTERSSATSTSYAGAPFGAGVGLLICPALISNFGWPAIFFLFGAIGIGWVAAWLSNLDKLFPSGEVLQTEACRGNEDAGSVPWAEIAQTKAVWTIIATHALSNVAYYSLLSWIPAWYTRELGLSLELAGALSFLPYVAATITQPLAGQAADRLLREGWELQTVRRLFQSLSLCGGSLCIGSLALLGPSLGLTGQVGLLTLATALHTCNKVGLFCTHADLSPRYAGALLAASTTAGAVGPIVGISAVGFLIEATKSFETGCFLPVACVQMLGGLIFALTSSHKREDFDKL